MDGRHSLMEEDPGRHRHDEPPRNDDPAEQGRANPHGDHDDPPAERRRTPDPLARQSER